MTLRRFWQDLTMAEIGAEDPRLDIAVLPLAAIEQHGPHLPLSTDTVIAEGHVARVVELMPDDLAGVFLPVQAVGWSEEHGAFPGTLTLSPETFGAVLIELAESCIRSGIRKLVFVNAHGGNSPLIDVAIQKLRTRHGVLAVAASWSRFGMPDGLFPQDEHALGIHGGAVETSLMLHLRPDLVRMEAIAEFPSEQAAFREEFTHLRAYGPARFGWMMNDLSPDGVVGDARLASADKGARLLDHAAAGFIALLRDVAAFDLDRLS